MMSTYNGQRYLTEQIESILKQNKIDMNLLVRDDGSTDNTVQILEKMKQERKLNFYTGKNIKTAKSFLNLVNHANEEEYEYFAFADQDDVWKKDKLQRAIAILSKKEYKNCPSVYCSNLQLVDENLKYINNEKKITTTTFPHSIVCSLCTGCTMVFNRKMLHILKDKTPETLFMHDDWIHKVCLAVGGKVFFDKNYRAVYYRQHGDNVEGGKHNIFQKLKIYFLRATREKNIMLNQYIEIKELYSNLIPPENLKLLNQLINYKSMNTFKKLKFIKRKCFRLKDNHYSYEFKLSILFNFY